jgi:hypothetical protein
MKITIPCACPPVDGGPRHPEGDELIYVDELPYRDAIAAQKDMALSFGDDDEEATSGDALAALAEQYVLRGLEAWTLVDVQGAPIAPTRAAIRGYILSDWRIAVVVSEAVEPLYNPQVLLPLVRRAEKSSPPGPTDDSTSAPTALPKKRPTRSKPSSTSSTLTDGTATPTPWPAGDSRSSPSAT